MPPNLSSHVRKALKKGPVYEVFAPKPAMYQEIEQDKPYLHVAVAGFEENAEMSRAAAVYAHVTRGEDYLMRRMSRQEVKRNLGKDALKQVIHYSGGLFGVALSTTVKDPRTKEVHHLNPIYNLAALQDDSPLLK